MKKIALSALIATMTAAHASEAPVAPVAAPSFTGAYVGGVAGYSFGKLDVNHTASNTSFNQAIDGFSGGLVLGYGKAFEGSKFYLGAEGSAVLDGAKKTVKVAGVSAEFKHENAFDLGLRAGLIQGTGLFYVGLGWANGKWSGTAGGAKFSKRTNGLAISGGADILMHKNLVLGVQVKHTLYKKVEGAKLSRSFFGLKVAYKFN